MKHWCMALGLAFPATLLVACKDQSVAPEMATPAMLADVVENLDNGNPRIIRMAGADIAVGWRDPRNGLAAAHATYLSVPGCGDIPDGGGLDLQVVVFGDPAGVWTRAIGNANGKVWIRVRDLNTPGDCFGARLVATGWGTLHYTDNNLLAEGPGSTLVRENAYGFRAEGTLTTPDGETVIYSGHSNCNFQPSNPSTWRCTNQVNIH